MIFLDNLPPKSLNWEFVYNLNYEIPRFNYTAPCHNIMVIELIGVKFGLKSYIYTWFYFGQARSASLHDKKFSYGFITATLKSQNSVGINILLI